MNNPPAITPTIVQELIENITEGEWQPIRGHCLCGMCPFGSVKVIISATEVETIAEEVCSRSNAELIALAPSIAREYLKLHEENTRLLTALNDMANIATDKTIEAEDLQTSLEKQRSALEMCESKLQREYDDGTGKISNLIYIQSIKEALALTATKKETKE